MVQLHFLGGHLCSLSGFALMECVFVYIMLAYNKKKFIAAKIRPCLTITQRAAQLVKITKPLLSLPPKMIALMVCHSVIFIFIVSA